MTAATRSLRFLCHRQRSVRSPHRPVPPHSRQGTRALPYKKCNARRGTTPAIVRHTILFVTIRRGRCLHRPVPPHSRQGTQALPYKRCNAGRGATLAVTHRTVLLVTIRRGRRPRRPVLPHFLSHNVGWGALTPPHTYLSANSRRSGPCVRSPHHTLCNFS